VAECARAGDGDGGLGEGSAIEAKEALPRNLAAKGTSGGKGQLLKMERSKEVRPLRTVRTSGSRKTVVELCAHRRNGSAELVEC
jgi:hypothetical protein